VRTVSGVLLVGERECAICTAARGIAPAIVLNTAELLENARAHLLVALVMGLRRERMPLCASCKGKLDNFSHHLAAAAAKGSGS
jgi:hypothetical protein